MDAAEGREDTTRKRITRRRWLAATGAVALAGATGYAAHTVEPAGADGARNGKQVLRLLGSATLPYRLQFRGTTVGGLSGLDYDPAADLWYAISDDALPRFYVLRIPFDGGRLGAPELLDVVPMRQTGGMPYSERDARRLGFDPESIRFRAQTRTLLWTSEGDRRRGVDPFVREMTTSGRHLRQFELPPQFRMDPDGDTGPRRNGAFEGLALTPDGRGAWAAMEHPLLQDGEESGREAAGAPCRFVLFDLASGQPQRQIAYRPEKISRLPIPGFAFADNGVSEILMQDAHRMLVLERGFSVGSGVKLRLFRIDVRDGDDVQAWPSLRGATSVRVPRKTLLADFDGLGLARLDNTEGMGWGPPLPGRDAQPGARTLLFVSDDNFNPLQITQFVAVEFIET